MEFYGLLYTNYAPFYEHLDFHILFWFSSWGGVDGYKTE